MEKVINLDECVVEALNLFSKNKLPKLFSPNFKRPIIIGSGNAAVTGKILFEDKDAVFADESDYKKKLENIKSIDGGILISASGKKHAPLIAAELKRRKIPLFFITNNSNSEIANYALETAIFPYNPEPLTYNTSTYLGMILSKTHEDHLEILKLIKKIDKNIPKNLNKYDSFFIILPDEFELMSEMLTTKFDELFGSKITGRVFTIDETKHAKTLVPSKKELFISLGYKNKLFGTKKLNISLPKKINYGALMCIGYYIIGKIQKQNPPYFRENVKSYAKKANALFN